MRLRNNTRTLRPSINPALNAGTIADCPALVAAGLGTGCSRTDKEFTPRLVLTNQPSTANMVYANWSKGFTAVGFNNFATTSSTPAVALMVQPETINHYEIGTKNEFLDRWLRVNLTAYWSDYSDLQIRQAVNSGGLAIMPLKKARIRGVELVVTPRLTLGVNGAYIDATIRKGRLNAFPDPLGMVNLGAPRFRGRLVVGALLDRWSPAHVIGGVFAIAACGLLLLAIGGARLALPGTLALGLAIGAEADLLAFHTARYFPRAVFGQANGSLYALFLLGGGMGRVLWGVLYDRGHSYGPALLMSAGLVALPRCSASACSSRIRSRRRLPSAACWCVERRQRRR